LTRAATDTFKKDRDTLDLKSQQPSQVTVQMPVSDVEEEQDSNACMSSEDSDEPVDEGRLSESELHDYGYGKGSDSEREEDQEEEQEDVEARKEDDINDLAMLGYTDF
jgi:hypothetical protein